MSTRTSLLIPGLMASALALMLSGCSFPSKTATTGAAIASGTFSSGETLQVLRSLNNGEIAQAELALDKSDEPAVEDVAETIIDDHTGLNERIDDMTERGIDLEKSPLSRGFASQAQQIQQTLANLAGTEFDCTYLKKQIAQHQLALETLRGQVKPDVNDPAIEDLLDDAIDALEEHREAAARARADIDECDRD